MNNIQAVRHHLLLAALAHAKAEEGKPVVQKVVARGTLTPAGRNDPCPCGRGQKFKKCCGRR